MIEPDKTIKKQVEWVRVRLTCWDVQLSKKEGKTSPYGRRNKKICCFYIQHVLYICILNNFIVVLCLSHLNIFFVVRCILDFLMILYVKLLLFDRLKVVLLFYRNLVRRYSK